MPYAIPTLAQLITQAQQDINSADVHDESGNRIDGFLEIGIVPVVVGITLPGFAYEHYAYQSWIAKQAVPWTATGEFFTGWAALKGVTAEVATNAGGLVTWSGIGTPTIPNGTPVTRSDGIGYITTASGTVAAGSVTVPIGATVAGAAGNFANNTTFFLANPIGGITSQSIGSTAGAAASDPETFDAFKSRTLAIYANPPQGGDAQDYVEWAGAVPGVTRVWVSPYGNGPGTVVVYFMMDAVQGVFGGFPQGTNGVATNEPRDLAATGDQLTVANVLFPIEPVTALVYLDAPINDPIAFVINGLGPNNTLAMRLAIEAALMDMFMRLASVGGTQNPQTRQAWPAIQPSAWYEALGAIPGLSSFSVGAPTAPISPGLGQLATLGSLTINT